MRVLYLLLFLSLFREASAGLACSQMCNNCQDLDGPTQTCLECYPYMDFTDMCRCKQGYSLNIVQERCFRCDSSCKTCSGPSVTQCLTCRTGMTLNTTSNLCVPPSNSTYYTQQWSYLFFGFSKLTNWTFSNSPTNTTSICDSKTLLGGYTSTSGGDVITRTYADLKPHYQIRVIFGFYFLSYSITSQYSASVQVDTLTAQMAASPVNSMTFPYSNGATNTTYAEITVDKTFTHGASTADIKFTSTSGSQIWGIRQVIVILTLCNSTTCQECLGPGDKQCTACVDQRRQPYSNECKCDGNYYEDQNTKICVYPCPSVPTKYYGDPDSRKCVKKVGTTPACPVGRYGDDTTFVCQPSCPPNRVLPEGTKPVYHDITNRLCVTICPTTEPYSNTPDLTCYSQCPNGRYRNNIDMTCVAQCVNPNLTPGAIYTTWAYSANEDGVNGTCVSRCPIGYFSNNATASCMRVCPTATPQFFKDNSTGVNYCVQTCPAPDFYGDPLTGFCTQECSGTNYGNSNNANRQCTSSCTGGLYAYVYASTKRLCVSACPEGSWAESTNMTCVTAPAQCHSTKYADNKTRTCVIPSSCSLGYFADNHLRSCVIQCQSGQYGNPSTYTCETACASPYFKDFDARMCVSDCKTQNTFKDVDSGRSCVTACNSTGSTPYADPSTKSCVSVCNVTVSSFLADKWTGAGWVCAYWCTPGYYADRSTSTPQCVDQCPPTYYADNTTGTGVCVQTCPAVAMLFGDTTAAGRVCVSICTANSWGDQRSTAGNRLCLPGCPSGYYALDANWRCVQNCQSNYTNGSVQHLYGYNNVCYPTGWSCPSGWFGDNSTNLCVDVCPIGQGTFGDPNITKQCVKSCPNVTGDLYFADATTGFRECTRTCTAPSLFGNNNTQTCVTKCIDVNSYADDQSTYRVCVALCSAAPLFYYANNETKRCGISTACPSTHYGENTTQTCVQHCPSGTYAYKTASVRICIDFCPSPTVADNSTGHGVCVDLCPTVPMLWADLDGIRQCVNPCPVVGDWYGQDTLRTCTQLCPPATYSFITTRRCLSKCPTGYYGDDTATVRKCWASYSDCTYGFGDPYKNQCVVTCTGPVPVNLFGSNKQCVSFCPPDTFADSYTGTRLCVPTCPGVNTNPPNLYGDPTTRTCVNRCITVGTWADWQTRRCEPTCSASPTETYSENITFTCVIPTLCPTTPSVTYGENDTRRCVAKCRTLPTVQYADPVSRTCLSQCQNLTTRWYGDTTTGAPICVISCPSTPRLFGLNTTNLCVSECPSPWYGDQSTTANRSCVLGCSTVSGNKYYAQDFQRICVLTCKNDTWGNGVTQKCVQDPFTCPSGQYGDNSTHLCVGLCPQNVGYFADPTTRLCVPRCPGNHSSNYSYADYSTRQCVSTCPASYRPHGTFGNNLTNTCQEYCSQPNTYGDPQSARRYCVTQCSQTPEMSFADPSTKRCVAKCPSKPNLLGQKVGFTCVSACTGLTYADYDLRICMPSCPASHFKTTNPNTCVNKCPSNPDLYGDTLSGFCQSTCTAGQFANSLTRLCVSSCWTASSLFQYGGRCTQFCPTGFYADNNGNCVTKDNCQTGTFAENSTTKCVSTCTDGFADSNSRYCIAVCPATWYADGTECTQSCTGGKAPSDISNLCVSTCVNNTYRTPSGVCSPTCPGGSFADPSTWSCVPNCPTSTHNTYGDTVNNICVLVCPTGYYRATNRQCKNDCNPLNADPITGNCQPICSDGYWGHNFVCIPVCPTDYYGYTIDRNCYTNITMILTDIFSDEYSKEWVDECPINPLTFGDPNQKKCVAACPGTSYFADPNSRRCETACTNLSYYADSSTNRCVLTCPAANSTFADDSDNTCKEVCTGNTFADNNTRKCVGTCPQDYGTFGYDQNWTCLKTCPTGWFSYNLTRMCRQDCPDPYFADSNTHQCVLFCDRQFADISTRSCVDSCAASPGYPLADNSTHMCVTLCPVNTDLYSSGNLCVARCPSGQFSDPTVGVRACAGRCPTDTYGEPLSGRCVDACLPGYWADDSTNLCVTSCPASVPSYADNATGKCQPSCTAGTYADLLTTSCNVVCSGNQFQQGGACVSGCLGGEFADPTTRTCVVTCPAFSHLFGETTTYTCVSNCSGYGFADNSTRECVPTCPDTPDPGTFSDPYSFQCVNVCPINTSLYMENSTQQCLPTCLTGYADNNTRYCVLQCFMQPQLYADIPNKKCVRTCPTGTYADNSTNNCVGQCPPSPDYYSDNLTGNCVLFCSEGYYAETSGRTCATGCTGSQFADNYTRRCVPTCPTDDHGTYADPTTNKCVRVCPPGYWAHYGSKSCKDHCPDGEWEDNVTKFCVPRCPSAPLSYGLRPDNACVNECPIVSDLYGDPVTQTCQASCSDVGGIRRFTDPISRSCVYVCPVNQSYYADLLTGRCTQSCSGGRYRDNSTQTCVPTCPSDPDTYGNPNFYCVRTCDSPNYASDSVDRLCIPDCTPYGTFADNSTRRCVSLCPTKPFMYADPGTMTCVLNCTTAYASNKTQSCVPICPAEWDLFADMNLRVCVTTCPPTFYAQISSRQCRLGCPPDEYADPITRYCVTDCAVVPPHYKETSSRVCVTDCPSGAYKYDVGMTCVYSAGGVSGCPGSYYADTVSKKCVLFCPVGTFAQDATKTCVTNCTDPEYADNTTRKCVLDCPTDPTLYKDFLTHTCVQRCSNSAYFTDNLTRSCVTNCSVGLYADNNTKQCITKCRDPLYGYLTDNYCVPVCPSNTYANDQLRTCQNSCIFPFFADRVATKCVQICPPGFWADIHTSMCQSACTQADEYRDNSTRTCVTHCPRQPFTFADNSSHFCVPVCPSGANYFGDMVNNVCVDVCPTDTFAELTSRRCLPHCPQGTFADPVNHACQSSCPPTYFTSNLTRECVQFCPVLPVKTYAYNLTGACQLGCPDGLFANNASKTCEPGCPFDLSDGYADNLTNICVTTCPLGTFAEDSSATCVSRCQLGFYADPANRVCATQCPRMHNYFAYYNESLCVTACPEGTYAETVNFTCIATCDETTNGYRFDVNNSCVQQCPLGYYAFVDHRLCVTDCGNGFFGNIIDHICYQCLANCPTCLALDNCTTCLAGLYLSFGECVSDCLFNENVQNYKDDTTMKCVNASRCPSGTYGLNSTKTCSATCPAKLYANDTTKRCQDCPVSCSLCVNSTHCTACVTNAAMGIDNMCYAYCDPANPYSFNGTCHTACPDGTYIGPDMITCQLCSINCTTCSGTSTNCTKCAGAFKYQTTCVAECPAGYYGDSNGDCQVCTDAIESCQKPVTFTTTPTVENYKNVIIMKFNQKVILSDNLTNILRIKLKIKKRMMVDLATMINEGIPFSYQLLPDGTIKIILDIDQTLTEPTFQVVFTSPTAVLSEGGSPLQSIANFIEVKTVPYYPPGTTADSPYSIATTILSIGMLLVFLFCLVVSPSAALFPLQVFQMFYLHSYINYTIPPNFFYFLKNLKPTTLSFLYNILNLGYANSSDYWQEDIPQKILDVDGFINFSRSCGSIILYIIVYAFIAAIVKILTMKINSNRPFRNLICEVWERRIKWSFLHQVLWTYCLPILFYSLLQFRHMDVQSPMDSFNIFLAVLFLVAQLSLPFIFSKKVTESEIGQNYQHLVVGIKQRNPHRMTTIAYFVRNILIAVAIVAPYDNSQTQMLLMIFINFGMLFWLLILRPYKEHLTNFMHILNEISLIGVEISMCVYIFTMQNSLIASRVTYGIVLIAVVCCHLTIALLYAFFKMTIGYQTLKQQFVNSQFYKLYIDDTYEVMMEKEIEDGLANQQKQGTIDDINITEQHDDMVKLRIRRRRKKEKSNVVHLPQLKQPDEQYERINMDNIATKRKEPKKRANIFNQDNEEIQPKLTEQADFVQMDRKILEIREDEKDNEELVRVQAQPIQQALAEKVKKDERPTTNMKQRNILEINEKEEELPVVEFPVEEPHKDDDALKSQGLPERPQLNMEAEQSEVNDPPKDNWEIVEPEHQVEQKILDPQPNKESMTQEGWRQVNKQPVGVFDFDELDMEPDEEEKKSQPEEKGNKLAGFLFDQEQPL